MWKALKCMFFKLHIYCLLLLSLSIGCQAIQYRAEPSPLMTLKPLQAGPENFKYVTDLDYFWWGLHPSPQIVDLTQIAATHGAEYGLTNLRIREESTTLNFILTFITLGIYSPRHVEIYGVRIPKEGLHNAWGGNR